MASKTDIQAQWDKKLAAMSKTLLQTLADNYLAVVSGLVIEIDKVQRQLEHPPFSSTPQELQVHKTILKKTEDNLTKFQTTSRSSRSPLRKGHRRRSTTCVTPLTLNLRLKLTGKTLEIPIEKEEETILNLPPTLTFHLPILFPNPGLTQIQ